MTKRSAPQLFIGGPADGERKTVLHGGRAMIRRPEGGHAEYVEVDLAVGSVRERVWLHTDLSLAEGEAVFVAHQQKSYDEAIEGELTDLWSELLRFMNAPIRVSTLPEIQETIDYWFDQRQARQELLRFAVGVRLSGIAASWQHGDPRLGELTLRPRTKFEPGPRYAGPVEDDTPLGFFENYDLYLASQEPLPPTIIARWGDAPDEYLSANPWLLTTVQFEEMGGAMLEARRRLRRLELSILERNHSLRAGAEE